MNEVTRILNNIESGDPQAASQLLPLVYDELRRLAGKKLAQEKPGQTLDATALVHEAYLRLLGSEDGGPLPRRLAPRFNDRVHFYAAAAEAMRRILIDNARRKKSDKRGGPMQRAAWNDNMEVPAKPLEDVLAIDDALLQLAGQDAQAAELVRLRFYAGLSVEEAAELLGIARASAYRTWNYAKAWLRVKLASEA
jgi:RNA polymerase sigma factor (TIGR02999 family)